MRLKALAAAPVGQAPENKNCRREVLDIPDLEFCAGEASITPGHKSETLEVPGTRAISAFFVGGGRGFESAKEACGGVRPRIVFWLDAIGKTKLKGKSSLHFFVVTRCIGFIHESAYLRTATSLLFSGRLKAAAAEGRAPENENCRREVSDIPDLEFCAGEASFTPVHRSETVEVPATRAISAFFILGGGAPCIDGKLTGVAASEPQAPTGSASSVDVISDVARRTGCTGEVGSNVRKFIGQLDVGGTPLVNGGEPLRGGLDSPAGIITVDSWVNRTAWDSPRNQLSSCWKGSLGSTRGWLAMRAAPAAPYSDVTAW